MNFFLFISYLETIMQKDYFVLLICLLRDYSILYKSRIDRSK